MQTPQHTHTQISNPSSRKQTGCQYSHVHRDKPHTISPTCMNTVTGAFRCTYSTVYKTQMQKHHIKPLLCYITGFYIRDIRPEAAVVLMCFHLKVLNNTSLVFKGKQSCHHLMPCGSFPDALNCILSHFLSTEREVKRSQDEVT